MFNHYVTWNEDLIILKKIHFGWKTISIAKLFNSSLVKMLLTQLTCFEPNAVSYFYLDLKK